MKASETKTGLLRFSVALVILVVIAAGCEWTGTSSDGSWDNSVGWVNFTGIYRGPRGGTTLVSDFSSSVGVIGGGSGSSLPETETRVIGQDGGTQAAPFTVLTGIIPFTGGSIKPGSVSINLLATGSGAQGQFEDGGGGLSGSFAQVPPAPPISGSGTINYDTGAYRINLDAVYLDEAQITYSYVILGDGAPGGGGDGGDGGDDGSDGISIAGGEIASIQVEQLGNKLIFRTSTGYVLEGIMGIVTTPGGDRSGRSSGDVTATYEVKGDIAGQQVTISGTFSGVYTAPSTAGTAAGTSGMLTSRIMQGIWMQPSGTADVYGVAPELSVTIDTGTNTNTTPTVTIGT